MQFSGDLNKQQSYPDDLQQTGSSIFEMKQGFKKMLSQYCTNLSPFGTFSLSILCVPLVHNIIYRAIFPQSIMNPLLECIACCEGKKTGCLSDCPGVMLCLDSLVNSTLCMFFFLLLCTAGAVSEDRKSWRTASDQCAAHASCILINPV